MGAVVVAGGSGLIGTTVVDALRAQGREVRQLVRREPQAPGEVRWDPDSGLLPDEVLDGAAAVVNLGGAGVGDRRWTRSRKAYLLRSRVAGTSLIATRLAGRREPIRMIQASAVGFYGDTGETEVREDHPSGATFLSGLCRSWEAAVAPAADAGVPVARVRTGIVLSPTGGALGPLNVLLRLGLAGPMGSGRQWWPWITLADQVGAIVHLMDSDVTGPVNLCAPEPARNRDLIRTLASALHRPAVVPVPGFALHLALGEFAGELLQSQRVVPGVLAGDGFTFAHPTPEAAARYLYGG
ncbi:TIGR01777 family protein [Occultella glacieicola]|uniref:TIGR01777 family protein n=1 Tax=Occultella glacieicola TaxID=2518684 RepID=A0ABY2DY98_9MICO|nr:TIGR01777 family oxidoreductase [Occultella glacieicola]TDE89465.1 TIGR01777 family protein [Occultella glacieicola]